MSTSMYELSVGVIRRGLTVTSGYLDAAESYGVQIGLHPDSLLTRRLAPDMLPFAGQIQRISDNAKGAVARLTGISAPHFLDRESSIAQLRERLLDTLDFVQSVTPEQLEGSGARLIEFRFGDFSGRLRGDTYLMRFFLPNFFFHIATVHAILRNTGVAVRKADYIGTLRE